MVEEMGYLLSQYPEIEIGGKYTSPLDALDALDSKCPDVVFLDIDMPGMDGLELSRRMREKKPELDIVFITAYSEYALNAYQVYPLDYILKPIDKKRFAQTIERLLRNYGSKNGHVHKARYLIRCFGKFNIDTGGNSCDSDLPKLSQKEKMLCAYLLYRFNQPVSRETLLEMLFPGEYNSKNINYLHVIIYKIRRMIDSLNIDSHLRYAGGGYLLEIGSGICDWVDFSIFAQEHRSVNAQNEADASQITGLYSGSYLEGDDFPWIAETQEWVDTQYACLMLQLSRYYAGNCDLLKAEHSLKMLTQNIPYFEKGWEALLRLYLDNENYLTFLRYYEKYAKALKKELIVKPEPFFTEYYKKIKRELKII